MAEQAVPMWFGSTGRELFGIYHPAASDCRDLAVLLCNPFGYEAMCAHRPYLHLATRLADRGFPTLRFDYHGTGDSSGDDCDGDRWMAWQESIHAAIEELRRLSGTGQVALFGLRLGANLALAAAAGRQDVRALALWAPFATGRAFLREELAIHRLRAIDPAFDRASRAATSEIEALGFAINAQTRAAIEQHRIKDLVGWQVESALVMTRDTALQEQQVADRLDASGASVTYLGVNGHQEILDNVAPEQAWSQVVDFLERASTAAEPYHGEQIAGARSRQAEARVWSDANALAPIRETAGYFGPNQSLFGVITHPEQAPAGTASPAVLLLAGGMNHHAGQNRMYTRWARRWAEAGFSSLRFDLAGFGDSGEAHGGEDGKLHASESVADVIAAIDHINQVCGSREVVMIGLCSGALQGFYAALDDTRIVRLGLLNWTRFNLDPPQGTGAAAATGTAPVNTGQRDFHSLRYYLRLATAGSTWRRTLAGEVDLIGIGTHFAKRASARVRAEVQHRLASLRASGSAPTALARQFLQLSQRGAQMCVVYNGDEPILDVFREQLGPHLRRLSRSGHIKLELLDGTDHVFTPRWSQARVFELMTRYVVTPNT